MSGLLPSIHALVARPRALRFLFVAMECVWIATVLALIDGALNNRSGLSLAWSTVLYPAAMIYESAIERARLGNLLRYALGALCGSIAVALATALATGVPPSDTDAMVRLLTGDNHTRSAIFSLAVIASLFAIVRGGLLAHRAVDSAGFAAGFHVGLAVLFLAAFGQQAVDPSGPSMASGAAIFLALGLFGLWLSRWQRGDGSARAGEQPGWPVVVLFAITATLGVGWLLGTLLDPAFMRDLLAPVFWLWDLLGRFLVWLISLLPRPEYSAVPDSPLPAVAPRGGPANRFIDLGKTMTILGKVMFYGSVGILVTLALIRNIVDLIRWLSRRKTGARGIAYSRSTAHFLDDLRQWLHTILEVFIHLFQTAIDRLLRGPYAHLPPDIRLVRVHYVRLLAWAKRHGLPRDPDQTPYEYLDVLRAVYPDRAEALVFMTETYVRVRYAGIPPSLHELTIFKKSWRRVRWTFRTLDRLRRREI